MTNQKALRALALLEHPSEPKNEDSIFSMSVRLPGELAERVISIVDYGLETDQAKPAKGGESARPRVQSVSRNTVLVALIEAGLEAVEAAASNKPKGRKNA